MRLRPYNRDCDFEYLKKWIDNERVHALWCANTVSFPISEAAFNEVLQQNAVMWRDSAFVATEDEGIPIGFFTFSVNDTDNIGFLKYIILDSSLRGKGYGKQMIKLALKYAFEVTGVLGVQLNVFDANESARSCYSGVGFKERSYMKNAFPFQDEVWGRINMFIAKRDAKNGKQ